MDQTNYEDILRRRQQRRQEERRRRKRRVAICYIVILIAVFSAAFFAYGLMKEKGAGDGSQTPLSGQEGKGSLKESAAGWLKKIFGKEQEQAPGPGTEPVPETGGPAEEDYPETGGQDEPSLSISTDRGAARENVFDLSKPEGRLADLLARAKLLADGYDYDGAVALLAGNEEFSSAEEVTAAAAEYEGIKQTLVEQDISQIPHVFFHSILMDPAKAFDGESDSKGYNQVMTTKSEFDKILAELYNRGYVLVRLHDLAHEETDENGTVRMVKGKIMLPEGKRALVMSQDDVCYYAYMEGDGFASRIVIGSDGKPTCEMLMDDGTVSTGAYDLVPILEEFIKEHPDFSYRGARAVLAFTGYEGILGYRTAASYQDENPNYEADRQQAAAVAQCLRDNGWELASHSWGHRDLGKISMEDFLADTNKWEAEVEPLLGPTDIILYPFGADVADWHSYDAGNERYNYLYSVGFRYFCNVDSSQNWVQLGSQYLRQGRRNLDGYRMWQDIAAAQEGGSGVRRLDDLFRSEDVFDWSRPVPVEWD